jgi:hypothetical protein
MRREACLSVQSIEAQAAATAPASAALAPSAARSAGFVKTLLKNLFFFAAVIGSYVAVETGYFSSDRTSRREWNEMERLKDKGKPTKAYEADFTKVKIDPTVTMAEGYWDYYNGATGDTVSIADGNLILNYTSAWIGSEFRHTKFVPNGIYRITLEAKVDGEPAAILMRNRQLDLLREEIPVTDGSFKTFTYHYVAPVGSRDKVRLIFMPDKRSEPKGKMTVRKFLIERLEG